jgi:hypothetical protein
MITIGALKTAYLTCGVICHPDINMSTILKAQNIKIGMIGTGIVNHVPEAKSPKTVSPKPLYILQDTISS